MLDATPLGLITNPRMSSEADACSQWLITHLTHGVRVVIPEIVDYEVRRELLRAGKTRGLARLDLSRERSGGKISRLRVRKVR